MDADFESPREKAAYEAFQNKLRRQEQMAEELTPPFLWFSIALALSFLVTATLFYFGGYL